MPDRSFPEFPFNAIVAIAFALALAGAAYLLTGLLGQDFRLWWEARDWSPAECTVLRPESAEGGFAYGYQWNGRRYESSGVGIGGGPTGTTPSAGNSDIGGKLPCWVNPRNPAQSLLDRSYEGWWWLPGSWTLAALLMLSALRGITDIWRWLSFRSDPPLTWAEWFRSFRQGDAWLFSLAGFSCLIAGILMLWFFTVAPWWDWRRAQHWVPTPCVIVEGRVHYVAGSFRTKGRYVMDIAFEYESSGKRYVSTTYSPWHAGHTDWLLSPPRTVVNGKIVEDTREFALGTPHTCQVSPEHPEQAFMYWEFWEEAYLVGSFGPILTVLGLLILGARPRSGR